MSVPQSIEVPGCFKPTANESPLSQTIQGAAAGRLQSSGEARPVVSLQRLPPLLPMLKGGLDGGSELANLLDRLVPSVSVSGARERVASIPCPVHCGRSAGPVAGGGSSGAPKTSGVYGRCSESQDPRPERPVMTMATATHSATVKPVCQTRPCSTDVAGYSTNSQPV